MLPYIYNIFQIIISNLKYIPNHITFKNSKSVGQLFFDCINRFKCPHRTKGSRCNPKTCEHYQKEICKNYLNHHMFVMVVQKKESVH